MLSFFAFSFYLKLEDYSRSKYFKFYKTIIVKHVSYRSVAVNSITIAVSIAYCTTSKAELSKTVNHICTLKMFSIAPAIIIFHWNSKNRNNILLGKKRILSKAESRISNKNGDSVEHTPKLLMIQ